MSDKRLHIKYGSKEDRLLGWENNRALYNVWRTSPDGLSFVKMKSKRQMNKCFICLTNLYRPIHVDHIFPLYLGGTNTKHNLCVVHGECNMKKGAKVYMTYKQACNRRRLFNKIRSGVSSYRLLQENPDANVGKKGLKNIQTAKTYLTQEELDTLPTDTKDKAARIDRLARRKVEEQEKKKNYIGSKKMQQELGYELKMMFKD